MQISTEAAAPKSTPVESAWWRRDWVWGLILVVAVILVYSPVGRAGYIWDDEIVITENPVIAGPLGLKEIWTTDAADICPLTLTSFWLEHACWGFAPLPYHLVNVLLQAACAVLLWRVLRSLRVPGAWLGAALWALHPVQVESVAWVTEMKNTQSGLFFLLSIFFFVKWLRAKDAGEIPAGWSYALTLLFAALAMASKSSTVILPVVLCLCAGWIEGRWNWRHPARLAPLFLMSIAASATSIWTQTSRGGGDIHWVRSWPERVATAGDAVWFYLGKLIWPHPLVLIYPRWRIEAGQWFAYLPLLAVFVLLFVLWLKRESWGRPWFFVFAYFLLALLPVLGLANLYFQRYSFVADHFQYLASMGPLALAGAGIARLPGPGHWRIGWLKPALGVGLPVILGWLSWQHAWAFESDERIWLDTLVHNPDSWLGHNNLGNDLLNEGHVNEALNQFQKALAAYPDSANVRYNLGNVFARKGQMAKAVEEYREALKLDPKFRDADNNLGGALFLTGKGAEAAGEFQKAMALGLNNAEVHVNLGKALAQEGDVDNAIAQYQAALRLDPHSFDAETNLGNALAQKGRVAEAIPEFQKALKLNPAAAGIWFNLGNALAQTGDLKNAAAGYEKALAIDSKYAEAHNGLGIVLARSGKMPEAITQFKEALRLHPGLAVAQQNLARAQALSRPRPGPNKP